MDTSFDTHRAVKALQAAGFKDSQAEAVVDAIGQANGGRAGLVTKTELDGIEKHIDSVREQLSERIDSVEKQLSERIDGVEKQFNERIDGVEKQFNERIDGVEKQFNERIDGVEKQFNERIDGVEKHIDGVEKRIDSVEKQLNERIDTGMKALVTELDLRLTNQKQSIILWLYGTAAAAVGAAKMLDLMFG